MNYYDKKFAAAIKGSPYLLFLGWDLGRNIHFHYQVPDEDLGNISLYAARNILEEDVMFAGTWGLDTSLVEIVEVEINYSFKNNKTSLDAES